MTPGNCQKRKLAILWLWLLTLLAWLPRPTSASPISFKATTTAPRPVGMLHCYTGEQIDPDLGMYYLRARYYQPGIGRFWSLDSYEGQQSDPLSLHKYLYCHADPANGVDPSGHRYTQAFGNEAHRVIEAEYSAEHPGATVGSTTALLGTGLKPDILNIVPPNKTFAEIKPLSWSGAAHGYAQITAYAAAFRIVDPAFTIDTWPNSVRTTRVLGRPVLYFNAQGVIFYTDEVRIAQELAGISTLALAREFIRRNLLQQAFQVARSQIQALSGLKGTIDGGRLEGMAGIATVISVMGGF